MQPQEADLIKKTGGTALWRVCDARKKNGEPCAGAARKGLTKCRMHAGVSARRAKAAVAVKAAVAKWGIDDQTELVDPGELLLRLVTQAAARVGLYSRLLEEAYQLDGSGEGLDALMRRGGRTASLIGYRYGVDRDGNRFQVEEAIRGLVQLEAQERDRAAGFAAKAVAAGLAERQVRLAEQQGALIVGVIRRVLERLELSTEQQTIAGVVVAESLREITP